MGVLSRQSSGTSEALPIRVAVPRSAALAAMVLMLLAGSNGYLGAQSVNEYEVKAAFLYKFANFVEWPPESATLPGCIAIVGQDPFGTALDEVVKGKFVNGRSFLVKRFKSDLDAARCHIVFISASEQGRVHPILDRLRGISTLTVSDIPGFCQDGGMIGFEVVDQKVRFAINPDAAERAGLKVSSKLLSVAKIVREGRP